MKKFFVLSVMLALFASVIAVAQDDPAGETQDAKKLFQSMIEKGKDLNSYKLYFKFTEAVPDKNEEEWRECELWFNGPGYIRLEVHDGVDKGSKVAYNESNSKKQVRAKASFMPFPISVSKNDERLSGFFESDWGSNLAEFDKDLKDGEFTYLGEDEIKGKKAYRIQVIAKGSDYDKVIIWIGSEEPLLLQYERFKEDRFVSRKTFYDVELNPKLGPKDFKP